MEWLLLPLQRVQLAWGFPPEVQVLSPPEFLMLELKLSIVLALVLSLPWLLWQGWCFIGPGLYPRERRFVYLLMPGSFILTLVGIAVMYFLMLPLMLQVLMLITRGVGVPEQLLPLAPSVADSALVIPMPETPPTEAVPGQIWLDPDGSMLRIAVTTEQADHVQILQSPLQGRSAVTQVFQLSSYVNFVLALLLGVSLCFSTTARTAAWRMAWPDRRDDAARQAKMGPLGVRGRVGHHNAGRCILNAPDVDTALRAL